MKENTTDDKDRPEWPQGSSSTFSIPDYVSWRSLLI